MVSKTSVIAVVLLVACPILIGYAMAFEDVERDVWDADRTRAVNGLLNNSSNWNWSTANTYQLNGIESLRNIEDQRFTPYYNKIASSPYTTIEVTRADMTAGQYVLLNDGSGTVFFDSDLLDLGAQITFVYDLAGVPTTVIKDVVFVSWNGTSLRIMTPQEQYLTYTNVEKFTLDEDFTIQYYNAGTYADPAAGWKIEQSDFTAALDHPMFWGYPDFVSDDVIITVDFGPTLASLTTDTTGVIQPETNGGSVTDRPVQITIHVDDPGDPDDESSYMSFNGTKVPTSQSAGTFTSTGNVWQFEFTLEGVSAYYIKDWPQQIGRADYYQVIEMPYTYMDEEQAHITEIYEIAMQDGYTYRVDYAHIRSSSYPVITDVTWDPNDLLMDSSASYRITFGSGQIGDSITWGGETYTITDGKITVNNVKIKVSDLQLDSRYKDGTRTNYINGREISTGANQLELSGTWGAVVSLSELSYSTVTSTEWQPGVFAWNGVDSSFALMGLITCVGVFIGLGMYGRRSGAKVGTLMLICGGAALIFLALI